MSRERETSGPVGDKAIKSSVRARERGYERRHEGRREREGESGRIGKEGWKEWGGRGV